MFTQQCFIRKNTKELIRKLKELGHRDFDRGYERADAIAIANTPRMDFGIIPVRLDVCEGYMKVEKYIDCGENEDMFLALAALSDDTDRYQWFVYNDNPRIWIFCKEDKFHFEKYEEGSVFETQDITDFFHKATPEEIVEYLKEK